jgi:branched-chain amino acid aminotransferase
MSEKKIPEYVWMDGEIIPFGDAKVHVFSPTAKYGMNAFEGLRSYWNEPKKELYSFRIRDHYLRLFESMKIMRLTVKYSLTECEEALVEILRKNNFQGDVHIRHTVYLGGLGNASSKEPSGMFIIPMPRKAVFDLEKGIRCSISSWVRISDNCVPPRVKVGANYQNSRLAAIQAKEDGYDEPIILTSNGKVSESATACFFMIRKGIVVTPPITASILESIVRTSLIELCRNELNFQVEEREIDRTEVYLAEEAFLCGSGADIKPITSIDKFPLGNGKVGVMTQTIMKLYSEIVRGINTKYYKWLTPTYKP